MRSDSTLRAMSRIPFYSRLLCATLSAVALAACGDERLESTATLERLNALAAPTPEAPGDTCTRVHPLWRTQLRLALAYADSSAAAREAAFLEAVYRPHRQFWEGYVGDEDAFTERVIRRWVDLETDPRAAIPVENDIGEVLRATNRFAAELAGRPQSCSDWYLVYGPGWSNMGGLGTGEMLVDFLGFGGDVTENIEVYVPHEAAHVLWSGRTQDPDDGTLLASIMGEGFATWFSVLYREGAVTPAQALSYSPDEWTAALEHEAELWRIASAELTTRDEERIRQYRAVSERVLPEAPGKIGYFIGYRIIEAYVARHGAESWSDLFELPLRTIVDSSGYAPS